MIRPAAAGDAPAICGIYNPYVEKTTITFEEEPVTVEAMEGRIADTTPHLPWLVFEEGGRVLGYAYAGKWKGRCAYRHSAESTVYVEEGAGGRGIGTALGLALLGELRRRDVHAVIAGIALPNEASRRLHEGLGFAKVAHFSQVGFKFGRWIDVGYWQVLLD